VKPAVEAAAVTAAGCCITQKKKVDIEGGALAKLLAVDVAQSNGGITIELAKHKISFGHLG
jgi:hypothetical protein